MPGRHYRRLVSCPLMQFNSSCTDRARVLPMHVIPFAPNGKRPGIHKTRGGGMHPCVPLSSRASSAVAAPGPASQPFQTHPFIQHRFHSAPVFFHTETPPPHTPQAHSPPSRPQTVAAWSSAGSATAPVASSAVEEASAKRGRRKIQVATPTDHDPGKLAHGSAHGSHDPFNWPAVDQLLLPPSLPPWRSPFGGALTLSRAGAPPQSHLTPLSPSLGRSLYGDGRFVVHVHVVTGPSDQQRRRVCSQAVSVVVLLRVCLLSSSSSSSSAAAAAEEDEQQRVDGVLVIQFVLGVVLGVSACHESRVDLHTRRQP